jgi:cytochrome c oxidase subunit 2
VVFYLNSADVLHSFWIPRLAGKRDVVPNQNNFFWLTATTPGVYGGQCAEFCGASHALMLFKAVAHEPAQFDAWVQQQLAPAAAPAPGTPAAAGLVAYNGAGCIACHAIRGTNSAGVVGPDLSHFGTRLTVAAGILDNNKENLVRWLRNPQAVKPGALMPNLNLSQQDAAAIADYLLSLQ